MAKKITIETNEEIELTEREQLIYEAGFKQGWLIAIVICGVAGIIAALFLA